MSGILQSVMTKPGFLMMKSLFLMMKLYLDKTFQQFKLTKS